jgi:hypothetical protein
LVISDYVIGDSHNHKSHNHKSLVTEKLNSVKTKLMRLDSV